MSLPLPTAFEMQALDALVMEEQGVSSYELMERVGRELTRRFVLLLRQREEPKGRRTLILVGPGNNGGDGLVLARYLQLSKKVPVVVLLISADRYSEECEKNIHAFRACGGRILLFGESQHTVTKGLNVLTEVECRHLLPRFHILVDALLGTGQRGPVTGRIKELLELVQNERQASRARPLAVAVDIPTGVSGDSGEVFLPAFQADLTLTVQYAKFGMTQGAALNVCGDIVPIFCGITSPKWTPLYSSGSMRALTLFPSRTRSVHKGTFGHLLVVAGSQSMPGAAVLVTKGALAVGTGRITALDFSMATSFAPEIMRIPLSTGIFNTEALTLLMPRILSGDFQSVVVGPGIGRSDETYEALKELISLLEEHAIPYVLDADGLNLLAKTPRAFPKLLHGLMTPHAGEAARLLQLTSQEVERDRKRSVEALQQQYGGTWLLKGPGTVLWDGKEGRVNLTGSSALATGGSGDVLSGIAGGILAQLLSRDDAQNLCLAAGELAAYLHGLAGEELEVGPSSASELAITVSNIFQNLVAVRSASSRTR